MQAPWAKRIQSACSRGIRAVALFELMVVMTVAGVLIIFFIYSAQYLMVSTRVSRVKEEQRVLTRALENYEADYGTFPTTNDGLHSLYGPIAYIVRVPPDPFSRRDSEEYLYIGAPGEGYRWILVSRGPDGDSDLMNVLGLARQGTASMLNRTDDEPNTLSLYTEEIDALLARVSYDPTNGLISGGDIISVSR